MTNIIKLIDGDLRCEQLFQALKNVVYERGINMSVPAVVGILELLKAEIIEEQVNGM